MSVNLDAVFSPALLEQVGKICDHAETTGARVAAWEEIQAIMLQHKIGWNAQVPPEFVGVHPSNRSGLGVSGPDAHHHGGQILQAGFSWRKASDATAVECPPAPFDLKAVTENEKYSKLSNGFIPPLSQLKLLSLGGAHTNAFLRAVKANCKSAVPKLGDAEGCLSIEHLQANKEFGQAVQLGLRWFVMHWQCCMAWPKLAKLIQAALNTKASSDITEIEVMLDMNSQVEAAIAEGSKPDWDTIRASAGFTMPPCTPWIRVLGQYVQSNAGGTGGSLLVELSSFQKAFACSDHGPTRTLGSEFMQKVSTVNFGPGQKFPYVVNAVIKANLASPVHKIVDGVCKLILPSNLALLTKKGNRQMVEQAEAVLRDARALCDTIKMPDHSRTLVIGRLDIRVMHLLMNKTVEATVFRSLSEVAQACIPTHMCAVCVWCRVHIVPHLQMLVARRSLMSSYRHETASCDMICHEPGLTIDVGVNPMLCTGVICVRWCQACVDDMSAETGLTITSPWDRAAAPVAVATGVALQIPETVEQMSDVTFQAEKLGFRSGCIIAHKQAETIELWEITNIVGGTASIQQHILPTTGGKAKDVAVAVLLAEWRVYKGKVCQHLPGWSADSTSGPSTSDSWAMEEIRGAITMALRSLYMKHHKDSTQHLNFFINPTIVQVNKPLKAGSLTLVAASQRHDKIVQAGSVGVGSFGLPSGSSVDMHVLKHIVHPLDAKGELHKSPWIVPFWMLQHVDKEKDANMEFRHVPEKIHGRVVHVPVATNKTDLKVGDVLTVMKISDGVQPGGEAPHKKRRAA